MTRAILTGYQYDVIKGVSEGLTTAEITDKYGGSGVHNEIKKILRLLGLRNYVELMFWELRRQDHHINDEMLIDAAEQILMLTSHAQLLLAAMVSVCLAHRANNLGEVRQYLDEQRQGLRGKANRTELEDKLLGVLNDVLDITGLAPAIKKALKTLSLPTQPAQQWPKLVRYYYLYLIFHAIHPDPGEAA